MQQAHKNENKRDKNKKQFLGDKIFTILEFVACSSLSVYFSFHTNREKIKQKTHLNPYVVDILFEVSSLPNVDGE